MRRHELSDVEWLLVESVLPRQRQGGRGRPPKTNREMLNAMMWILKTGAPWRDLPERFGPWQSVYHYFSQWRQQGVFDRVLEALQMRLDEKGCIDWDLWCVDGSSIRASRAAGGASKKVGGATPVSRKIMPWAARAADSGASSTWLLTARAFPSPSKSARDKRTNQRGSSR